MIERVGPTYDGPRCNRRIGEQFVCTEGGYKWKPCGWRSPVMKWRLGAKRHEEEHKAWHRHQLVMMRS